jgi:hypothetical protein
VADDNRPMHRKLYKRLAEQLALGLRAPDAVAGAIAKSKAGPIEGDDPTIRCKTIKHPALEKIMRRDPIAVKQHDRRTGSALDVMKPNAIDRNELTPWGIHALCPGGKEMIDDGGGHERCAYAQNPAHGGGGWGGAALDGRKS